MIRAAQFQIALQASSGERDADSISEAHSNKNRGETSGDTK